MEKTMLNFFDQTVRKTNSRKLFSSLSSSLTRIVECVKFNVINKFAASELQQLI